MDIPIDWRFWGSMSRDHWEETNMEDMIDVDLVKFQYNPMFNLVEIYVRDDGEAKEIFDKLRMKAYSDLGII